MNFLLAGALLLVPDFKWKETMIYANLLVGVFNLLPIYPLDGGRILKSVLNKYYNLEVVEEILNNTSNTIIIILTVIASIGILYLKNIAILFIIAYLWFVRIAENRRHRLKIRLNKIINNQRINM